MGALLSSLFNFSQPLEKHREITPINFEDVKPSDVEKEDYKDFSNILKESRTKMTTISEYGGCSREIQEAISHPNTDIEARAWGVIVPEIRRLDSYYSSSLEIVNVFEKIVAKLCKGNVQDNIDAMNAITKLLADIMCFSYDFDQAKVSKFQIQNDFSYYKRVLTRMKSSPNAGDLFIMPGAKANNISLFYAQFCPLTSAIARACTQMIAKDPTGAIRSRILELLPKISQMCSNIVSSGASGDLTSYCIKVLANVIVLYDHSDPAGAFVRGSKLNINSLVKLIQVHERADTRGALDFITRASLNFNDPSTPRNVKALIRPDRAANVKNYETLNIQGPF